jgi:hypothetical protein
MPFNALLGSAPDVHPAPYNGHHTDDLTATILDHLNEQTVISLDSLICLMPQYTWNQIFHAVDQLARCHRGSSFAGIDSTICSFRPILWHNYSLSERA